VVLGKKGIIFTLIALLLAGLFILLYSSDSRTPLDSKVDLYSMRVNQMRLFENTYEDYIRDAISASGRYAVNANVKYLLETKDVTPTQGNLTCRLVDLALTGQVPQVMEHEAERTDGGNLFIWYVLRNQAGCSSWDCWIGTSSTNTDMDYYALPPSNAVANTTYGLLERFRPTVDVHLGELIIMHNMESSNFNATLDVYSEPCNGTLFLLERISLNHSDWDPGHTTAYMHFVSNKSLLLEQDHWYAFLLYSNDPINVSMSISFGGAVGAPAGWVYHYLNFTWAQNVTIYRNYTYDEMYGDRVNVQAFINKMTNYSQSQLDISSDAIILNMSVEQDSAWSLDITTDVWIVVSDNFSNYTRRVTLHSPVNLNGVYEPLWALNRSQLHKMKRAPFNVDAWGDHGVENLTDYMIADYYWERFGDTPSYLYRLMNWTNATGNFGIETVINDTPEVVPGKGFADWQFFGNSSIPCQDLWTINVSYVQEQLDASYVTYWQLHNNLTLDTFTLVSYNISALYWNGTCPS
jgi:hypothetical protein